MHQNEPNATSEYLNSHEAASRLGVHRNSVMRWLHEGLFPNATRIGREYRIPASDIAAYLASRRVKPGVAA